MKKLIILLAYLTLYHTTYAGMCDTVCQATASKKYFVSGVTDASTYTWTASGGISILSGQGTDTITVNFNAASGGVQTICVTPSNSCGAQPTATCFNVFVQTTPTKPNAGTDQAVCVGSALNFSAVGQSGAVFTWTRPTGASFMGSNLSIPASVLADSGMYIVYQSVNGCISAIADTVIGTVNSNPGAATNTTNGDPICETATKMLIGSPTGGTWSIVSGGGSISGTTYTPANVSANTTATVRYTIAANGACAATQSDVNFTVNVDNGAANNMTTTAAICESATKSLSATPAGGTWSIVSGGGSISGAIYTPADIASNTSVTIQYTTAVNGGCAATTSDVTFTVNSDPGAAMNTTSTAAVCETGTVSVMGTPSGGSWSVVSGGGSISGTTYTPANITSNTTVTVRYTIAANGACAATTSDASFLINSFDGTATSTTSTAVLCESATRVLSAIPSTGTWSVVSGGGSIAANVYTPANVTANTNVTLRYTVPANGACAATSSDAIFDVIAVPTISAALLTAPTSCGGNGTFRISGLIPSTNYTLTYSGTVGSPVSTSSVTSNAAGQLNVTGPVGVYTNITATSTTGSCASNILPNFTIVGPAPTGTPVILCK